MDADTQYRLKKSAKLTKEEVERKREVLENLMQPWSRTSRKSNEF